MTRRFACVFALAFATAPVAFADEAIDFEASIRPLLRERCVACHGRDKQKGGLRLDAREPAFRGGDSGPAFKPSDAENSELLRRVTSTEAGERMPPDGDSLTKDQIESLRRWIADGAKWIETEADRQAARDPRLDHWAWKKLAPVAPPDGDSDHPIDRFLDVEIAKAGLVPSPEADRRTLLRRLTFDLHGLPPSPEETADFLADDAPLAYERLVDRLLASPRHGERSARHWLDIAHYADTHGFERDKIRDHAWRYRDYVIDAFNADKPYGRFLEEQLAGDALWPDSPDAVIATGFLTAGPWDFVGQAETPSPTLKRAARADDLDDMVAQVMTACCGVTIHCARCHDHKLDPISQREYYGLWAAFSGVVRGDRDVETGAGERLVRERTALRTHKRELATKLAQLRSGAIDLADLIGGGDGHGSGAKGTGIDIKTGQPTTTKSDSVDAPADTFVAVEHPWIDGVVLPGGGDHAVPVSSTGVVVRGLPATSRRRWDAIRNGPVNAQGTTKIGEVDYAAADRSLLGIHANAGVTFDLDAIRKDTGWTTLRFESAVGYGGRAKDGAGEAFADARLLLDGEIAWEQRRLGPDGSAKLRLAIPTKVRFLTLLATDGDNGISYDQVFFGDPKLGPEEPPPLTVEQAARVETLSAEARDVDARLAALPEQPVLVYAAVSQTPQDVHVLRRGNPEDPLEPAAPTTIGCVPFQAEWPTPDAPEGRRRAAFARWTTSVDNPLTRRVIVNRLWRHHFGVGLVDTPSDFGLAGGRPSHPELLDWLAQELSGGGDSLKRVHRLIVTSAAYRRRSDRRQDIDRVDSGNRLLARMNPRRLEAESLRDATLAASGALNLRMSGPGYRDFEYKEEYAPVYTYVPADRPELWRRTIYRLTVRTTVDPFLTTLDCPNPANLTPTRNVTTTAVQALALWNNEFVVLQAKRMADDVTASSQKSGVDPIDTAFIRTLARRPTEEERRDAKDLVDRHGLATLCRVLLNSSEFVYVD